MLVNKQNQVLTPLSLNNISKSGALMIYQVNPKWKKEDLMDYWK